MHVQRLDIGRACSPIFLFTFLLYMNFVKKSNFLVEFFCGKVLIFYFVGKFLIFYFVGICSQGRHFSATIFQKIVKPTPPHSASPSPGPKPGRMAHAVASHSRSFAVSCPSLIFLCPPFFMLSVVTVPNVSTNAVYSVRFIM